MVEPLYFHMKESEKRCFIEDVPSDTIIAGNYKLLVPKGEQFEISRDLGVKVIVTDPDENAILDRVYSSEGRFVFTAHKSGEHKICISSDSSVWFGGKQLRVYLDILVGDHTFDYHQIAVKERLSDLQLRVRQLIDQIDTIAKDQDYQRIREEQFRALSESTNKRVTWWSIGQLILLISIGFWQMRHLRSFFQAKKLV